MDVKCAAAIYTPIDYGFPDDGMLAAGELNKPAWVDGDIDSARIEQARNAGQVFNYRDLARPVAVLTSVSIPQRR